MAITSQLIGKLGGAEVEVTPVSGAATGANNSIEILHTIQVPAGETWLIAVIGKLDPNYRTSTIAPEVYLGNQKHNGWTDKGSFSIATLGEGEVTFRIKRKHLAGTDSFTGHIYTVKM